MIRQLFAPSGQVTSFAFMESRPAANRGAMTTVLSSAPARKAAAMALAK